jgi:twinkle protein
MKTANEQVSQWLEDRGLSSELASQMGWGAANHKDLGLVLKIPFERDGKIVTTQFRKLDEKQFRFQKDTEVELWNVDVLYDDSLRGHPLIIAEGACDALALIQCGFKRTIGVPGWSDKNANGDSYEPFKRHEKAICGAGTIIVAQHADNTGATMLRAISNFFAECDDICYTVWPTDCKDANDTLLLHGQEAVVDAISSAKSLDPPGGIITGFTDLPPRPERIVWRLDQPFLDRFIAFRSGDVSVLTGVPGAGKTTFVTWCAHNLVRANGVRVGLCSFETDPTEIFDHLCKLNGTRTDFATGADLQEMRKRLDRHYRLLHRVEQDEHAHSLAWIESNIRKLAARDGCSVIFIDPWNELEHNPLPGENIAAYTNYALGRLRQIAERYNVHVCIVAHPRKLEDNVRPSLYHIADAAAWANKPSMGWTIHTEKATETEPEHVSLTCLKVRSRQATKCRPGRVRMLFDEDAMTYREKMR